MVEKILNNTTPYGKIRASHEGSLHSSTLNAPFFSANDEVTREQRQQLTQAEECEILIWDTSEFIPISRTTN